MPNSRLTIQANLAPIPEFGKTWIRQFNDWIRDPCALTVGSYAYGRNGKPKATRTYYILGFVTYRGDTFAIETETQAEDAGAVAAELVAMVLTEARQRAASLA